jgi:hypothetical protein
MIAESTFAAALGLSSMVAGSWFFALDRALMCASLSERLGHSG